VILGVSFDTGEDNAAFAQKFSFTYPLLCDRQRTMGLAYGAASEPGTGGYANRVGVIIGADGKITHYDPSVSAQDFPQVALDAI
jgi:peroxiredoxin Q/BCP